MRATEQNSRQLFLPLQIFYGTPMNKCYHKIMQRVLNRVGRNGLAAVSLLLLFDLSLSYGEEQYVGEFSMTGDPGYVGDVKIEDFYKEIIQRYDAMYEQAILVQSPLIDKNDAESLLGTFGLLEATRNPELTKAREKMDELKKEWEETGCGKDFLSLWSNYEKLMDMLYEGENAEDVIRKADELLSMLDRYLKRNNINIHEDSTAAKGIAIKIENIRDFFLSEKGVKSLDDAMIEWGAERYGFKNTVDLNGFTPNDLLYITFIGQYVTPEMTLKDYRKLLDEKVGKYATMYYFIAKIGSGLIASKEDLREMEQLANEIVCVAQYEGEQKNWQAAYILANYLCSGWPMGRVPSYAHWKKGITLMKEAADDLYDPAYRYLMLEYLQLRKPPTRSPRSLIETL